jgi:transposase-like protein
VANAHVRFGGRAGETERWKHRYRAPVRPYHFNIRLEHERLCCLVLIGVRADGRKELVAVGDGYRESTESWSELLRDLKRRGMCAPVLAIGDGALGFWGALREVFPESREQRCWVHRTRKESTYRSNGAEGASPAVSSSAAVR